MYGPGKNMNMSFLTNIINLLKSKVNSLIAYVHFRQEYDYITPEINKKICNILTDLGIDLIVGSGPHVLHKTSIINNKPCFMSLGNFVFDSHVNEKIVKQRILDQQKTLKKQNIKFKSIYKRTHSSRILHLNMNIVNNNINWEYRYIECSLNKVGIPSIEKINNWRSAKTLKLLSKERNLELNHLINNYNL